ncbi:hypothetical protein BCT30_13650 [Enterovibrio norvegicus]|uniref:prepilin-type N-terminal cleavage/methylation domain-containing protein n=1 Tax=Enterovibrio norvegicus TaxID=188144 RepID=UPI000C83D2CE|nr:prepilin-type N-terminal cleavage/methylation domain-containing protein [Enterovibrio norvegicus]PMN52171.1 hypothetical protein BCT30_13650 [Enterovibrio norvegicus]
MKRMKGFTLIEGIITLSVLAVLTAVAVPVYTKNIQKQRLGQLENDIRLFVDYAAQHATMRWKDVHIHLVNIPKDEATPDSSWCLVASEASSVSGCNDSSFSASEKKQRVVTVFGTNHPDLELTRLTNSTKFTMVPNNYSLFIGKDRKESVSFLDAALSSHRFTATVRGFQITEFE